MSRPTQPIALQTTGPRPGGAGMSRSGKQSRAAALLAGLGLGLVAVGPAAGQATPAMGPDPAFALPPLPPEPPALASGAPEVRVTRPVVAVPPGGIRPTWYREADDPVATARHAPKHVEHKRRSTLWRRLQGKFYGYPEEFVPRPLGAALYDHTLAMTANAAAARLTLYDYDFVQGSAELSPRGNEQLLKLSPQLLASPYPLIVERTLGNPPLAAARRELVAARLAQGPCPIPPDRVLVGEPIARGLSGTNAQVIANNALGRVQQYGPPIPINSTGINSPSGVTFNPAVVGP